MKVKVFSAMRWICLFMLTLDIGLWIFIFIVGGLFQESVLVWGSIVLFLAVLPVGLFVWNIFTMENEIIFDNQGISRKRFGRIIRHFDWEEIKTISTTSEDSFSGWIYISNEIKSFNHLSITRMRLDKKVIYLHMSEKAKTALLTFAPEFWKEQVEKIYR